MAGQGSEADIMPDQPYRRGQLEPIWGRLQEHEHDIRELYRASAQAHERVNATNETIAHLREDVREWKDQMHRDNREILGELRIANTERAAASGAWHILKWGLPLTIAGASAVTGGIALLYRMGIVG